MNRPLLKLYAFNFFQSRKKENNPHHVFGFAFSCLLFLFLAGFPAFLFARVNLPIESKVWSRVARTNYRRTKQGYYMRFLDLSSGGSRGGARGGHCFLPNWGAKNFFGNSPLPPPPHPPLSEGLDSPLHSVTLTKCISYSYIYKFHQQKLFHTITVLH